jgi:hypothetical protein
VSWARAHDVSKSRRLELLSLSRDLPFEGLLNYARSAVTLAPHFVGLLLLAPSSFPVADGPLAGRLGLGGELLLGVAHLLVGDPHPGGLARPDRGAGGDLEPPEFLGSERGLLVGVVLLACEHMHQNRIASLRAVATIALPCPRRDLTLS